MTFDLGKTLKNIFSKTFQNIIVDERVSLNAILYEIDFQILQIKKCLELDTLCPILIVEKEWPNSATLSVSSTYKIENNRITFIRKNDINNIDPIVVLDVENIKHMFRSHDIKNAMLFCIIHELTHYKDLLNKKLKLREKRGFIYWSDDSISYKEYDMSTIYALPYIKGMDEYLKSYNELPWEIEANSNAYSILFNNFNIHFGLPMSNITLNKPADTLYIKNSEITHTCINHK